MEQFSPFRGEQQDRRKFNTLREQFPDLPLSAEAGGAGARIFVEGWAHRWMSLPPEAQLAMLRETDPMEMVPHVRRSVSNLLEGTRHYKGKKDSNDLSVPTSNRKTAMTEVLNAYPEETFYFLNEGRLIRNVGIFHDHFIPELAEYRRIIYAMKANPKSCILGKLQSEGIDGFDCATFSEVLEGLNHTDGDGIFLNHPIKKEKDIRGAHSLGVSHFTAQDRDEIEKILKGATSSSHLPPEIAVRLLTPNNEAVINLSEKFGTTAEEGRGLLKYIQDEAPYADTGVSIHTGSQNTSLQAFKMGIELMGQIASDVGGVSSINVGGGLPVNYRRGDNFNIRKFLSEISESIRGIIGSALKLNADVPKIIIEPGRSMVANTLDLAIPILSVQGRDQGPCIYIDDGIFGSFSDSPIHKWRYPIRAMTKDGEVIKGDKKEVTVYGNTCDSKDVLDGRYDLPIDIKAGDYLWVPTAGSYMDSQRSNFHLFEPPRYVVYNCNS